MTRMLTILITDLKLFFYTPIAYIITFAFYGVNGLLFWFLVNRANAPGMQIDASIMQYMTGGIVFWLTLLLLVPVISMRLIAYESENKRLSHLFSTPASNWDIILGKYFSALCFYSILWAPTLIYFFILSFFSNLDSGSLFSSYLGLFLVGSFTLSIGLFASAMSKNQIISAIITFFLLLGILLLSMFESLLGESALKTFLQTLNYVEQFSLFSEGIIDTRNIVFFLSFTIAFLFASVEIIHFRRHEND